jgi:hypothetical protein
VIARPLRRTLLALAVCTATGCSVSGAAPADPISSPSPTAAAPTAIAPAGPSASPSPGPATEVRGFVVWARGGLPAALADRAAALPGVTAATTVASQTLGLTGSRLADGTPVDVLREGWRVPVDVAAVAPAAYAATVTGEAADHIRALRPGEVLLGERPAALRGLGAGDRLDLGTRRDLVVAAVLPDEAITRAEILVHVDDAPTVGLDRDGSLFVETDLAPGPARDLLADALAGLVPDGATARVVDLASSDRERRRAPLVLSLEQVKETFGEFAYRPVAGERAVEMDPDWVAVNIVDAEVPLLGTVRCHRDLIEPLRQALEGIVAAGAADEIDPSRYAGCWNPRRIAVDGSRLSRHAWGIALDVNVDLSVPGGGEVPDERVVAAFAAAGFVWGGEFLVPDNHHFEFVGERG